LDAFEPKGCGRDTKLMLVGASNLWFPASFSIVVMPESAEEKASDLADQIRTEVPRERLLRYADDLETLRDVLDGKVNAAVHLPDGELRALVAAALTPPPTKDDQAEWLKTWDPIDLLAPEWRYLQRDPHAEHEEDAASGLTLSKQERGQGLRPEITRVLAVERLRKVNALVGFTRIDALERVGDLAGRLAPLTRNQYPEWTVATEDRGEGIFLQLDEARVAAWEERVDDTQLWKALKAAHRRNFNRRFSETAEEVDPDSRMRPPRYWLIHTLSHVLIRELAMTCGYSAASLSERLYAWPEVDGRTPAAGLLIVTTASDSDGTLGGLVQMSTPHRLERTVASALTRATRCSSDPICAKRTPRDPEDFLHGAACHCCVMASETSCERANRFLDRRFLINLPGSDVGFFGTIV
jgi:Domain of unknown function (DUF1998)